MHTALHAVSCSDAVHVYGPPYRLCRGACNDLNARTDQACACALVQVVKPPAAGAWNTRLRIDSAGACKDRPAADLQQEQRSNGSACAKPQMSAGIEQPVFKKRKTLVLPRLALPTPAAAGTGAAQHAHKQLGADSTLPYNLASAASDKQHTAAAAVIDRDQAKGQLQQSQHAAESAVASATATMTAVQLQQPAAVRRNRKLAVTAAARSVAAESVLAASRPEHAARPAAAATVDQGKTASNPALPGLQLKQRADEQAAVPDAAARICGLASTQSACSKATTSVGLENMPAATFGAEPEQQLQAACTASLKEQAVPEAGPQPAAKLQVDDETHQAVKAAHPARLLSSKRRPQRLPAVLTSVLPTLKDTCDTNTLNAATLVGECLELFAVQHRSTVLHERRGLPCIPMPAVVTCCLTALTFAC
jgi:hypothetical protein